MKRILVADDSVTIQKVIALTFADEPFEVKSVGTGSEALELVKSWNPDIILADVIMPQMNGYELCKAVKQQEETRSIPVLLLAGTFEAFDEDEAGSAGADGFITKPFESGELIEKVRTLVGGVAAAPQAEAAPAPQEAPPSVQSPAASGAASPPEPPPPSGPAPRAPSPAAQADGFEPDIWDILSETSDEPGAVDDGQGAGFGPIEDAGVVDVGSFDVGVGKTDPHTAPLTGTAPEPDAASEPPAPEFTPPPAPAQPYEADEKSRVENMEKDFFGFETEAAEEAASTGVMDEAIEEVTFEMEQPQFQGEGDAQEVPFPAPEDGEDQPPATGEGVSPDLMAPDFGTGAEPEPIEVLVPDSLDIPEAAPDTGALPGSEPAPAGPNAPEPEPPLDLPVELTPDLQAEITPEPAAGSVVEPPPQTAPGPVTERPPDPPAEPGIEASAQPDPGLSPEASTEMPPAPSFEPGGAVPDDEAIRKLVEEKVEKIAWEVVPEMAEVIIREAIQKIKDGT